MTALKGRAIKAFLQSRDRDVHAVLIYGPDGGLVRERSDLLAKTVVDDLKDPFNYIELSDGDIKAEPARLVDEAAALSFAGGERIVRLRTSGEASAKSVEAFLQSLDAGHVKPNALVIVEAGELTPRSGVRKAFEKAKRAVALPCYADGPADVRDMARDMARAEDLRFDEDALDLVVSVLGEDHGITRAEIEKLMLYKGPAEVRSGPATITVEDVQATLIDGLGGAMDETAGACADGAASRTADALHKAAAAGASPIGQLRALQRQFSRLKTARAFMDEGESAAAAMKRLRPPVFFAEQRAFESRLYKWQGRKLDQALRMLIDTELEAKMTGAPQRELVERAALRLALMAGR